jgi:hypothetical protein
VPVPKSYGWVPYEFSPGEDRAGLLGQAGFLALYSHSGRSSPTLRGRAIRELLMCQPVPNPPGNVNFTAVQDTGNKATPTARDRLTAHSTDPVCAGCHRITDPIGLSLENYDATGGYRTHEKTALIDASGTFEGKPYVGLQGLTSLLRESPDVPACLVQRMFEYGTGREARDTDAGWLEYANGRFAAQGHRLPDLMRLIATSTALAAAKPDQNLGQPVPAKVAYTTNLYRSAR